MSVSNQNLSQGTLCQHGLQWRVWHNSSLWFPQLQVANQATGDSETSSPATVTACLSGVQLQLLTNGKLVVGVLNSEAIASRASKIIFMCSFRGILSLEGRVSRRLSSMTLFMDSIQLASKSPSSKAVTTSHDRWDDEGATDQAPPPPPPPPPPATPAPTPQQQQQQQQPRASKTQEFFGFFQRPRLGSISWKTPVLDRKDRFHPSKTCNSKPQFVYCWVYFCCGSSSSRNHPKNKHSPPCSGKQAKDPAWSIWETCLVSVPGRASSWIECHLSTLGCACWHFRTCRGGECPCPASSVPQKSKEDKRSIYIQYTVINEIIVIWKQQETTDCRRRSWTSLISFN